VTNLIIPSCKLFLLSLLCGNDKYYCAVYADMESIDSLARAINSFAGGVVLVSHDMRLISQVAKEIWICDHVRKMVVVVMVVVVV